MHFVQLDCDLRKRSRERGTNISARVTRRDGRSDERRDGLTTHASRPTQRRSPFVYPPCRPSCQSQSGMTDARLYSLVVDDVYVASRQRHEPCETLQSSLIPRYGRPTGRPCPSLFPFTLPSARVRRTNHGHVRG